MGPRPLSPLLAVCLFPVAGLAACGTASGAEPIDFAGRHAVEVTSVEVDDRTRVAFGSPDGSTLVAQITVDGVWGEPVEVHDLGDGSRMINPQSWTAGGTVAVMLEWAPERTWRRIEQQGDCETCTAGLLAVAAPGGDTTAADWAVHEEADDLSPVLVSADGTAVTHVVDDPETGEERALVWEDGTFTFRPLTSDWIDELREEFGPA